MADYHLTSMFAALLAVSFSSFCLPHEEKSFLHFMREHNQYYTGDEYYLRLGIFITNLRHIKEFNSRGETYKKGINRFAALTPTEFKSYLGGKPSVDRRNTKVEEKVIVNAPESLDWRDKNVVNQIKDQGECGSCWAFSATQAQESAWALKKNELLILSEQNLVDCVTKCYGCDGGWSYAAYDHVIASQSGQFALESDYPYKGVNQKCTYDSSKGVSHIEKYVYVEMGNERGLFDKVATYGPASIAIVVTNSFMLYSSGIFNDPSCTQSPTNHAVGCVGYGTENGIDYWIVRNSWGKSWGEEGYIRMIRFRHNQCGVATDACVPVVE